MSTPQRVFISYASKEETVACDLCQFLEEKGIACFYAPRDIRPGQEYAAEIIRGIDNSQSLVLLLSKASNESPHVLREIERAVSKKISIVVYKLEEVELTKSFEYFLMASQWLDADRHLDFERIFQTLSMKQVGKEHTPKNTKHKKTIGVVIGSVAGMVLLVAVLLVWIQQKPQRIKETDKPLFCLSEETAQFVEAYEDYELGDTVTLGSYYGEAIDWRILKLDKRGRAVLIADDILTFKAFDTAESGSCDRTSDGTFWDYSELYELLDEQAKIECRGSSDWETSTLRAWLNSDEEVVTYIGAKPTVSGTCDLYNGYDKESGFLSAFSEEEKAALVKTQHGYEQCAYMGGQITTCEDDVYLLQIADVVWFDEAGVSKYAAPTEAALRNNDSDYYDMVTEIYHCREWYYWTLDYGRVLDGMSGDLFSESTDVMLYGIGYTQQDNDFICGSAYVGEYGVRPAITVDLDCLPKK